MIDYLLLALFIPVLVCLFWFVELLCTTGENKKAKKHLSFFMFCGLISFIGGLLFFKEILSVYATIYAVIFVFSMAQIPAFYLYLASLTENNLRYRTYLKHYAFPLLTGAIVFYYHYIFISYKNSIAVFNNYFTPWELTQKQIVTYNIDLILRNGFVLFGIFYLIVMYFKMKRHFKKVIDYYSNVEHKRLYWIALSISLYLLFSLIGVTLFNSQSKPVIYKNEVITSIPFLILAVVFWYIGFLGNRQQLVIIPATGMDNRPQVNLTEVLKENLVNKIKQTIETDKLYLKPDICLPDLAREVGTNRYYLSKIINDEFGMNFNNYINQFRIAEAVNLMNNNSNNYSLADISIKSGFNVYISFVRNFKRFEKVSPERYLKRKRING